MTNYHVRRFLALLFLLGSGAQLAAQGSAPVSVSAHIRSQQWMNARYWPGINPNDTISDQAGIESLMASNYSVIYFPKGVYRVPSSMTNSHSNRTFIFADSAIIDGVFHVAAGTAGSIVRNVSVLGRVTVTERFGSYFCQNVSVEAVTIADTSSVYRTQHERGARGVHIYTGSRDMRIGDIQIWANDSSLYALGIDCGDTSSLAYDPTNIRIGSVTIDINNDSSAIRASHTRDLSIDKAYIRGYDGANAVHLYANIRTSIGDLYISGKNTTKSGLTALWVEADSGSSFGNVFIDVDTVTNKGILLSACTGGTRFGDVVVRSGDTVGAKYGFDIESSRDVSVNSIKTVRFAQGVRIVNGKNIRMNFLELDSNRIGFATAGTNDTFLFLNAQYSGNTADHNGVAPENMSNAVGPLLSAAVPTGGITIKGSGQPGAVAADSVQPVDGLSAGALKLISTSGVAGRGAGIYFGNTIGSVDRFYAGIHPYVYTGADSGQGGLSFLIRKTQTDSTLRRAMGMRQDGRVVIGADTTTEFRLPTSRGSDGQILKISTGGNLVWSNDSVGSGGSGDNVQVDTTAASGGVWNVGNPILTADSGIGLNRVASTDSVRLFLKSEGVKKQHLDTTAYGYVVDTLYGRSAVLSPSFMARTSGDTTRLLANGSSGNIKLQTGSGGRIHFWDENEARWTMSSDSLIAVADFGVIDGLRSIATAQIDAGSLGGGELLTIAEVFHLRAVSSDDTILAVSESGDTTVLSSYDNTVLQLGEAGLTEADSLAANRFIVDTNGGHLWYLPRSKPSGGAMLSYVDVAGNVDSAAWITPLLLSDVRSEIGDSLADLDSTNMPGRSVSQNNINWKTSWWDLGLPLASGGGHDSVNLIPNRCIADTCYRWFDTTFGHAEIDTIRGDLLSVDSVRYDSLVFLFQNSVSSSDSCRIDSIIFLGPKNNAVSRDSMLCDSVYMVSGTDRSGTGLQRIAVALNGSSGFLFPAGVTVRVKYVNVLTQAGTVVRLKNWTLKGARR